MHAASLGEYEQGLPVIENLMAEFPEYTYLITFFSPSGYEVVVQKSNPFLVTYLPMDSPKKVKRFLDLVNPRMALFVKYEIWPNYFKYIHERAIPLFIISGRFYERQVFFRNYGGIMRKSLQKVTHFFVQDEASSRLLKDLGHLNVTVSGDTRFDRVYELGESRADFPEIEEFLDGYPALVAGSTWPQDEDLILYVINGNDIKFKVIIAPHIIDNSHIDKLQKSIDKKSVLFSELQNNYPGDAQVLIIDTIGHLSRIYRFGELAYVGGGFETGLHNTLEPAVYGIPILIGPQYSNFKEVRDLVEIGGVMPVNDREEFQSSLLEILGNHELRSKMGKANRDYIEQNKGASVRIVSALRTYC